MGVHRRKTNMAHPHLMEVNGEPTVPTRVELDELFVAKVTLLQMKRETKLVEEFSTSFCTVHVVSVPTIATNKQWSAAVTSTSDELTIAYLFIHLLQDTPVTVHEPSPFRAQTGRTLIDLKLVLVVDVIFLALHHELVHRVTLIGVPFAF